MDELPIIQKTYDFIKWYVPLLNRLPNNHKFILGQRIINGLYDVLEGLIDAKYSQAKIELLVNLNNRLDVLRYQTRLLHDFNLISIDRYEYVAVQLQDIGVNLGKWIKQQKTLKLR